MCHRIPFQFHSEFHSFFKPLVPAWLCAPWPTLQWTVSTIGLHHSELSSSSMPSAPCLKRKQESKLTSGSLSYSCPVSYYENIQCVFHSLSFNLCFFFFTFVNILSCMHDFFPPERQGFSLALTVLDLTLKTRLPSNSEICLSVSQLLRSKACTPPYLARCMKNLSLA